MTQEEIKVKIKNLDLIRARLNLVELLNGDWDKAVEIMKKNPEKYGYTKADLTVDNLPISS